MTEEHQDSMKSKDSIRETLAFEPLTEEEKSRRGILGRLYGPCASIAIPTRNGRLYSEKLWDYQFEKNSILKEMFANGGVPMEIDHPVDREETDSSKIAAMMPEMPKKDKDGHLVCYCDIIDTPCGRIAYQLAKYGFKLGISSRGTGDIITDDNGNESVDPETYDLTTFDLVLVPAVEDARLSMTESLDMSRDNTASLRKALREELDKATPEAKKVMHETLHDLQIDLGETEDGSSTPQQGDLDKEKIDSTGSKSPDEATASEEEAINDGSEALVRGLQEALTKSAELEQKVRELQEQLAVSDAEVSRLKGDGERQKSVIVSLTRQVREAKESSARSVSGLEKRLSESEGTVKALKEENRKLAEGRDSMGSLRESISSKDGEIGRLRESLEGNKATISRLNEQLLKERKDSEHKVCELTEELSKTREVADGYKRLANSSVNKYIGLKAVMLGIDQQVILNNLRESYTLKDVDDVCNRLQGQEVNLGRLPFRVDRNVVVKVNESRQVANPRPGKASIYDDDYVDDNLLRIAGAIK